MPTFARLFDWNSMTLLTRSFLRFCYCSICCCFWRVNACFSCSSLNLSNFVNFSTGSELNTSDWIFSLTYCLIKGCSSLNSSEAARILPLICGLLYWADCLVYMSLADSSIKESMLEGNLVLTIPDSWSSLLEKGLVLGGYPFRWDDSLIIYRS